MASKITEKYVVSGTGMLEITDDGIDVYIEGEASPRNLKDLLNAFNGKEIKFSFAHNADA